MFHLLPGQKILRTFIFINTALLIGIAYFINPSTATFGLLKYLSFTISLIDLAVLFISEYLWRLIWLKIPFLAETYFPDLNGIWEGRIIFQKDEQEKFLLAKARIRQNLWKLTIDMCSETSKSHTLLVHPIIESGNHRIYYIFHNISKNPAYPEYTGSSTLTVKLQADPIELDGHYYTMRGTVGRIELKRTSTNPKEKYELY